MAQAAGICGSFASGILECWVDGTHPKFLHPGWAAQSGIAAAYLAREQMTWPAQVLEGRFGLFACIAPPDAEGSLKEIEHAFDNLKADGVGLLTSYQDKYLGDASFAPVYEELNRRKAVVYVHPTSPACCRGLVPGIPPSSIEYATDPTRTIAHLVFSGTVTKYPTSAGYFPIAGTLPFLTGRFIRLAEERRPRICRRVHCRSSEFHYELAQGNTAGQIAALLKLVPVAQVLYGTDYPFRDGAEVNQGIADWGFSDADRRHRARQCAQAAAAHQAGVKKLIQSEQRVARKILLLPFPPLHSLRVYKPKRTYPAMLLQSSPDARPRAGRAQEWCRSRWMPSRSKKRPTRPRRGSRARGSGRSCWSVNSPPPSP